MVSNKNKFQSLVGYEKVLDNNVKNLDNNMSKLIFDRYIESISKVLSNKYYQEFVDSLNKYTVKLLNNDSQDYLVAKYDYVLSKLINDEDINQFIISVRDNDELKEHDRFLLSVYKVAINNLNELIESLGLSEDNEVLYQLSADYYDLRLQQSNIEENDLLELMDDLDKLVELEVNKLKENVNEEDDIVSVDTSYMNDLLIENSLNVQNNLDKETVEDSVLNFVGDDDSNFDEEYDLDVDTKSELSVDEDDINLNIDLSGVVDTLDDAELSEDIVEVSNDEFDFSKVVDEIDTNTKKNDDDFTNDDYGYSNNESEYEHNNLETIEELKEDDYDKESQYELDFGYNFDEVNDNETEDEIIEVNDETEDDIVEVNDETEDDIDEDEIIEVDNMKEILNIEHKDDFIDEVVENVPETPLVETNEVDSRGNAYNSEIVEVYQEPVDVEEEEVDDEILSGEGHYNSTDLDSLHELDDNFNLDDFSNIQGEDVPELFNNEVKDNQLNNEEYIEVGVEHQDSDEEDFGIDLGSGYNFDEDEEEVIELDDNKEPQLNYQEEVIELQSNDEDEMSIGLNDLVDDEDGEDKYTAVELDDDLQHDVEESDSSETIIDDKNKDDVVEDNSSDESKEKSIFSKDKLSEFLGLKNIK